jgi:succinate dehydrogenase / fumarate reductase flavoprotein subunit
VYLDFADAIKRQGEPKIRAKYGNLFDMYERITAENAYQRPMRIYPALHYTMGGLWVDYHLMSNIDGLFVVGEANFSDHGANRLGASALMQGLADGYFVLPFTLGNYFASTKQDRRPTDAAEFKAAEADVNAQVKKLLGVNGKKPATEFHRELGHIRWEHVGMSRTKQRCEAALGKIRSLRDEFWKGVTVPGSGESLNVALERAGRVADFFDFGELLTLDALTRNESCGGHFREEYQYPDGEAKRDDEHFSHVAAWEYNGPGKEPTRNQEPLPYEAVVRSVRSYK